jgi:hypothetical protein
MTNIKSSGKEARDLQLSYASNERRIGMVAFLSQHSANDVVNDLARQRNQRVENTDSFSAPLVQLTLVEDLPQFQEEARSFRKAV